MALPFSDRFTQRLRQWITPNQPLGEKNAQIIALASGKGGVGKTTSAVNLAYGFAQQGLRTLLVDLDPQCHIQTSLGLEAPPELPALGDVLLGRYQQLVEASYATPWDNLWAVHSNKDLIEIELAISGKIGKELLLTGALHHARSHFDLILLDCPPALSTLTLNGLCAASWLLVPCDMSVLSLEGVQDILGVVETVQIRLQRHLELLGIIATRYDARNSNTNDQICNRLTALCPGKLLQTKIPQSTAINQAHVKQSPVAVHASRSTGALAYQQLAVEIAHQLQLTAAYLPPAPKPVASKPKSQAPQLQSE